MAKTNWREVLEKYEDKVKDGIRRAYELACDGTSGIIYVAEIDTEGNISIGEYVDSGSQSYRSWKGTAIEIARIEAFDCWDGDDFSYFPQDDAELTDEEKTAFAEWAQEREEEAEGNPGLLSEWNPEVAKRWGKVYREEYIAAYADDYVEDDFSRMIKDLEMQEKYAEL